MIILSDVRTCLYSFRGGQRRGPPVRGAGNKLLLVQKNQGFSHLLLLWLSLAIVVVITVTEASVYVVVT